MLKNCNAVTQEFLFFFLTSLYNRTGPVKTSLSARLASNGEQENLNCHQIMEVPWKEMHFQLGMRAVSLSKEWGWDAVMLLGILLLASEKAKQPFLACGVTDQKRALFSSLSIYKENN